MTTPLRQKVLEYVYSNTCSSISSSYYYLQKALYDEAGRVDVSSLGAASLAVDPLLKTNLDYYPWNQQGGRLKTLQSGISSNITSLQSFEYDYVAGDRNRPQLTAEDKDHLQLKAGGTQTQTFHYDSIDRLTDAAASGGTGGTYPTEAYDYNETTGNLATKAGVIYTYGDSNHPHAVTSLSNGNSYAYDSNGNMTSRTVSGSSYSLAGVYPERMRRNAENRLVGVSGTATASFVYDGDGQRVKGTAGGITTVYIGASFEWSGSTSTMKRYYYSGSVRIAVRVGNGSGTTGLSWLLGDHLGSTSLTVDMSAARTGELRYKPFGETRFSYGITPTTFKFTGQREQVEIGLYYYQARWFDASLGRFISADTIVPEPGSPLSWDRFMYTRGNPLKYVDPTGHEPWYIPGWKDDYKQRQAGNTCAVVATAVSISILFENKYTQKDVQLAYFQTYRLMVDIPQPAPFGSIELQQTYKIGYPGIGVPPGEQAWIINRIDPRLQAAYSLGTRDDLLGNLTGGNPTIVTLTLPDSSIAHAIVAIGYDPETDELWFFDPAYGEKRSENEILARYNYGRGYNTFGELWSASNPLIRGNSMVTVALQPAPTWKDATGIPANLSMYGMEFR